LQSSCVVIRQPRFPEPRRRTAPSTQERYGHTRRLVLMHLCNSGAQPIRSVSSVMIERFLYSRMDAGTAPKTAIVDVRPLSTAFKRAEDPGYLDTNSLPAVSLPKSTSTEREIYTMEEVDQLVAATLNLDRHTVIRTRNFARRTLHSLRHSFSSALANAGVRKRSG